MVTIQQLREQTEQVGRQVEGGVGRIYAMLDVVEYQIYYAKLGKGNRAPCESGIFPSTNGLDAVSVAS